MNRSPLRVLYSRGKCTSGPLSRTDNSYEERDPELIIKKLLKEKKGAHRPRDPRLVKTKTYGARTRAEATRRSKENFKNSNKIFAELRRTAVTKPRSAPKRAAVCKPAAVWDFGAGRVVSTKISATMDDLQLPPKKRSNIAASV